jgi:hypothetical protein
MKYIELTYLFQTLVLSLCAIGILILGGISAMYFLVKHL